ncbi:MAG TPA: ABC transporter ATP-binding protein [Candidatus Thermoplasmatota archaeon]|nr:ABC transporter ATP-binding protein [Candidatus Thermoplasmatota archaeon]
MQPAILARGLVKRYGDFEAVKGIDFEVPRGVVYGFLGPNGAGKSSTMRMLYGLSPRTAGTLEVLGMDVAAHGREVKRRMGVVPQASNLDEDMTARENLVSYGRFFDLGGPLLAKRVDELLEYVKLTEKADERCTELSGGMKRRLLIARALLNDPELLLLDEPTTGLDPQSRSLLWERIRELRRQGKTVLLTTHYMEEAEKLCDDLLIIDEGRIIERGTPRDLVAKHVGREVLEAALPPEDDARILQKLGGTLAAHERHGDELRLFGERGDAILEELHRMGVRPTRHLVRRATLEDVFLKLTGRRLSD